MATGTYAEFLAAHPGRAILEVCNINLGISEAAAATLVQYGAARLCDSCGRYHTLMSYDMVMMTGAAILDVSEMNATNGEPQDVGADVLAMLSKVTGTEVKAEPDQSPAAPAWLRPRGMPSAQPKPWAGSKEDIATRAAISKADWYKANATPILLSIPEWVEQRDTATQSSGPVEQFTSWQVNPNGTIEKDPPMADGSWPRYRVTRLADIDGIVPFIQLKPGLGRYLMVAHRWLSGLYLDGRLMQ